MKKTVYYFSGTGNSLAIARELHSRLDVSRIEPIAAHAGSNVVKSDAELVVIVCPLYFFGLPALVADFVRRLEPEKMSCIYAVVTRGSPPGCALFQLKAILAEKGLRFSGGFYVNMGTNYIPLHHGITKKRAQRLFHRAQHRVEKIARFLKERKKKRTHDIPLVRLLARAVYHNWIKEVHEKDRHFHEDGRCTSCGICMKICPVKNIHLVHGIPFWGGNCQQCLACLHFCPVSAIQYDKSTVSKRRYHHPSITAEDIMMQRESP